MRQYELFGVDLSSLPQYIDERLDMIMPMLFRATRFLDNVTIEEGVKGTVQWNGVHLTGTLRDKSGCGFQDSMTFTFPSVQLKTTPVGMDIEICRRDFNGKWTQILNPRGAQAELESLSFPDAMLTAMIQLAAEKWQRLLLLGDTASTDVNIVHHDGLLKRMVTNSSVGTYSLTGVNVNDPIVLYEAIEDFALSFPEEARDNPNVNIAVYVGRTVYERIRKALFQLNYFHVAPTSESVGTSRAQLLLPRSEVMLRKFSEIDSQPANYGGTPTSLAYGVVENYIVVGTDNPADYQDTNMWYETSSRTIRASIQWYSGLALWRPELFIRTVTS
ncbi:MAG: hypothetical protein KatS3mg038_2148 [Candidatus Kapaibacterium sp.]|nr:MAG: hypothetical protein KatS3mg038_2148 [Candidatus Kapabacteria bacterium]